jgi:hypothetical protein
LRDFAANLPDFGRFSSTLRDPRGAGAVARQKIRPSRQKYRTSAWTGINRAISKSFGEFWGNQLVPV